VTDRPPEPPPPPQRSSRRARTRPAGPPAPELVRERLATLPAVLAAAARAAPPAPPAPGEWTPHEIVRHLIAVELEVWHVRLDQLAAEAHPHWAWAEPGPWPGSPGANLESLLATHAIERARTLELLDALGPDGWARRGTHDTYGELDVAGLMTVAADHDDEHLASLRR
jgi:DinB family protein